MSQFPTHTLDSAPEAARPILEGAQKKYGMLPNLLASMAEAPALLEGYATLGEIFEKTSFSTVEKQVVLLTVSRRNLCHYCMAAHSTIADMSKVPAEVTDAIRDDQPLADPKLQALRVFADALVQGRGFPEAGQVEAFLAAGFTRAQVLEVVLGVGFKTLSNYTNHLVETQVDPAFSGRTWQPVGEAVGV